MRIQPDGDFAENISRWGFCREHNAIRLLLTFCSFRRDNAYSFLCDFFKIARCAEWPRQRYCMVLPSSTSYAAKYIAYRILFIWQCYCTVDSHSTLYNVRATANNWQSISSGYYGCKSLKAVTCEMPLAYEGFQ